MFHDRRTSSAWGLLVVAFACLAAARADRGGEGLLRVPSDPIGSGEPYSFNVSGSQFTASRSSQSKEYYCQRSQIDFWTYAKTVGNNYIGAISANCTDGSILPGIVYGYNGTENCTSSLYNVTFVSNAGYKSLGNFSYRSAQVLESFLDFQPVDSFFDCGKFLAPIGFSASSSCFGLTNFQVICGRPYAEPSCPLGAVLVPSSPLGSTKSVLLGMDNYTEYTSGASKAVTRCCRRGAIKSWTLSRTGHLFFGIGQHSSVASVSAECTDQSMLPSVTYGYNGTENCTVLLNETQTVPNPYSNQFFYSAGALLDGFISFGAPNPPATAYFACNTSQVAVGFRAASNCLGLTTFQVVCGTPNSLPNSADASQGINGLSVGAKAGIAVAVSFVGLLMIAVVVVLLGGGHRKKMRRKEKSIELDGEPYEALTDLSEVRSADLVDVTELHKSQVEGKVYRPGPMSNQVESIIRVQLPDQRDTLVFQGEEGDLSVPPDQDSQGLQELGQINPDDLKCKRKATGELFKLGSGGSGTVYLGALLGTTDVAIKVIDRPSPQDRQRFEREVMLLKACRHPNVIQFLGASLLANQTLLVMEFMYGGDLFCQLRQDSFGTFRWNKRGRSVALDVAKGLAYLHSHSILHLDIKSPNILLNNAGAKISDIGLGRSLSTDGTTTVSYGASFPWCAPEQILNEPCSSATDIYGLGSVLWEICTGEMPTRLRQFRSPKVPEEAPPEIAALFSRCHSKHPGDRPSATEAHRIILESRQTAELHSVNVSHLLR